MRSKLIFYMMFLMVASSCTREYSQEFAYNKIVLKSLSRLIADFEEVSGRKPESVNEIYRFQKGADRLKFRDAEGVEHDFILLRSGMTPIAAKSKSVYIVSPEEHDGFYLVMLSDLTVDSIESAALLDRLLAQEKMAGAVHDQLGVEAGGENGFDGER